MVSAIFIVIIIIIILSCHFSVRKLHRLMPASPVSLDFVIRIVTAYETEIKCLIGRTETTRD